MLCYHILLLKYPKAYFFEDRAFFFPPFPLFPFTLTQPFFLLLG